MSKSNGSDDYRRVYNERLDLIIAAEERAEELERWWAIQLKVRNFLCYEKKPFDLERYRYRRGRMRELEREIAAAKYRAQLHREIWQAMEPPTKRRPRKTVLVDGVRTKIEREYAR
jgi:hypothetical protein